MASGHNLLLQHPRTSNLLPGNMLPMSTYLFHSSDMSADMLVLIAVVVCFLCLLLIAVFLIICYQYFSEKCRSFRNSCASFWSVGRGRACDIDNRLVSGVAAEAAFNDGILWTAGRTILDLFICIDFIYCNEDTDV